MESFIDVKLEGYNQPELKKVTIEASCPTGFEGAVADEVKKRLNGENVIEIMGRVLFDVPIQDLKKVMELRTVDHIFVIIGATMGMYNNYRVSIIYIIEGRSPSRLWKENSEEKICICYSSHLG